MIYTAASNTKSVLQFTLPLPLSCRRPHIGIPISTPSPSPSSSLSFSSFDCTPLAMSIRTFGIPLIKAFLYSGVRLFHRASTSAVSAASTSSGLVAFLRLAGVGIGRCLARAHSFLSLRVSSSRIFGQLSFHVSNGSLMIPDTTIIIDTIWLLSNQIIIFFFAGLL